MDGDNERAFFGTDTRFVSVHAQPSVLLPGDVFGCDVVFCSCVEVAGFNHSYVY
jgi:hypothetical protein